MPAIHNNNTTTTTTTTTTNNNINDINTAKKNLKICHNKKYKPNVQYKAHNLVSVDDSQPHFCCRYFKEVHPTVFRDCNILSDNQTRHTKFGGPDAIIMAEGTTALAHDHGF